MATYRSFHSRTSRQFLFLAPITALLGVWLLLETARGRLHRVGGRQTPAHVMSPSEQAILGLIGLGFAALALLFARYHLFRRVEWNASQVTAYDWRNRIVFQENATDLVRLDRWDDNLNRERYTLVGRQGSVEFPASWQGASELTRRIAETIAQNDAGRIRPSARSGSRPTG